MNTIGTVILLGLMALTAGALIVGIVFMARGGNSNRKHSNKLMVMRVTFQGAALAVMALLLLMTQN